MKVSKALIERYHQGLCSPDEQQAVERWLLEEDDPSLFPDELLDKRQIKDEIWQPLRSDTIGSVLPEKALVSKRHFGKIYWSVAAVLMVLLLGTGVFWNRETSRTVEPLVTQNEKTKALNTEFFDIELGDESQVTFDKKKDLVDFCGIIKIIPKKNMKLSFSNFCDNQQEVKREVTITGGTTYFALDLKNNQHTELLVMNEDLLFELPPLVRNSLMSQFGI